MSNGTDLTFEDFLRLPLNDSDLIRVVRMFGGKKKELVVRWGDVKKLFGSGQGITLQVNGVNNLNQTLLNLVQGSGVTITDNGNGNIEISATGGGGGVQSVTGNLVDNTNPVNPIVDAAISADSGNNLSLGSDGLPFYQDTPFALEVKENGTVIDSNVDEINFLSPLKATQTAAGKVDVELQAGTLTGAMYEIATREALTSTRNAILANNKLFVTSQTANNVRIFDANTLELLATIAVTEPLECSYLSSINEVWVGTFSTGLITRIDATTNIVAGTIADGQRAKRKFIEYIPISGNARCYIITTAPNAPIVGSCIRVYDLITLTLITTINLTTGDQTLDGELILNAASAMHRKIVLGTVVGTIGLRILNPETNTITASSIVPTGLAAGNQPFYISYNVSKDELAVSYSNINAIAILTPATATTFTTVTILRQITLPINVRYDEVNDLLLYTSRAVASNSLQMKFCKLNASNYVSEGELITNCTVNLNSGSIHLLTSGRAVIVGSNNTAGVTSFFSIVKYA